MFLRTANILLAFTACATALPYAGDIVIYWNNETSAALTASVPGLSSIHEGWADAIVHSSMLLAAQKSNSESRTIQQLAVSHAAHNTLSDLFSARNYDFDASLRVMEDAIMPTAIESQKGQDIGEAASRKVLKTRVGDNSAKYVRYDFSPPGIGVYQTTPPSYALPYTPQGGKIKPFCGKLERWRPPMGPTEPGYEEQVQGVKDKGSRTNSTRTPYETETAYFWLESTITFWNRFAAIVIGESLKDNVLDSASFFAKLNWAIANSGFIGWDAKFHYNTWRPITAIRYPEAFLCTGHDLSDPDWTPLLDTPLHPEYLSGHATYAGGAGGIIKRYLGSDKLKDPVAITTNATYLGPITRTYDTISKAVKESGDSRIFGGIHFQFSCDEGAKAGDTVAQNVWTFYGNGWE